MYANVRWNGGNPTAATTDYERRKCSGVSKVRRFGWLRLCRVADRPVWSRLRDTKCQQHVAGAAAERAVARAHVQHSAGDDGTGPADGRTLRRHTVYGGEVAVRVE